MLHFLAKFIKSNHLQTVQDRSKISADCLYRIVVEEFNGGVISSLELFFEAENEKAVMTSKRLKIVGKCQRNTKSIQSITKSYSL
jgi:hypothetical protein